MAGLSKIKDDDLGPKSSSERPKLVGGDWNMAFMTFHIGRIPTDSYFYIFFKMVKTTKQYCIETTMLTTKLPSGKLTVCYGKLPSIMGKSTNFLWSCPSSQTVKLPEGIWYWNNHGDLGIPQSRTPPLNTWQLWVPLCRLSDTQNCAPYRKTMKNPTKPFT